jgi:hypothetical protein
MSAVQLGVHSTQDEAVGTTVLTVDDPNGEVSSVTFEVQVGSGSPVAYSPDRTTDLSATERVYEKEVPRDIDDETTVQPVVTLTDSAILRPDSAVFASRSEAPSPALGGLRVASDWGRIHIAVLPEEAHSWKCWVRRGAWPTDDRTAGGLLLDRYLRAEAGADRTSLMVPARGADGDLWYVVVMGYDRLGRPGPRLTDSVSRSSGEGSRTHMEVWVEQINGVERRRAEADIEFAGFTDWLIKYNQRGFLSEIGWYGSTGWNDVARRCYELANQHNLWVAVWAVGEWWGDYEFQPYKLENGIWVKMPQAQVVEEPQNLTTANYKRGLNIAGAEFGSPDTQARVSWFSNANPGVHGVDYKWNELSTYQYMRDQGNVLARIPFRWERIQPVLGGALDGTELQRMKDSIGWAQQAGLEIVLDVHNYGAYYLHDSATGEGVRYTIGVPEVTFDHFKDLWYRVASEFNAYPGVIGYGLMNEPVYMAGVGTMTPAETWATAAQYAADGIRAAPLPAGAEPRWIVVGGYNWSHTWSTTSEHGEPFVTDPEGKVMYETHYYPDRDRYFQPVVTDPTIEENWVRWSPNGAMWDAEGAGGDGADVYSIEVFREGCTVPSARRPLWRKGVADAPVRPCDPAEAGCGDGGYAYRVRATNSIDGTVIEYAARIRGSYQ